MADFDETSHSCENEKEEISAYERIKVIFFMTEMFHIMELAPPKYYRAKIRTQVNSTSIPLFNCVTSAMVEITVSKALTEIYDRVLILLKEWKPLVRQ